MKPTGVDNSVRCLTELMNKPGRQTVDGSTYESNDRSDRGKFGTMVEVEDQRNGRCIYAGWIVLVAYTLFLVCRARYSGEGVDISNNIAVWDLQNSHQLIAWIGGLVLRSFCEFVYFVFLGFMVPMAYPHHLGKYRWLPINLRALVVASILTVLVHVVEIGWSWHLAATVGLVFPLLGCLFGTWVGTTWLRGRWARFWLLPKIALLVLVITVFGSVLLFQSLEERPLPFETARVTSTEKRRLVKLIRSKSPRALTEGQIHTLKLTDHDINVLLAWGLSLGSPDRKAKIGLAQDYASLSASAGITSGDGKTRYLNLEMDGTSQVEKGIVRLDVHRCKLGTLRAPRWLLNLLSPVLTSLLNHDRLSKPFMDAIREVSIGPGSIAVTYGRVDMPSGFREDLFGPARASAEVLASARAQVDNLLTVIGSSPDTRPDFGMCFETVFSLARERSITGSPILENRAAIFALGILLGHPRIEEFLGSVLDGCGNVPARQVLRRVPLRGRSDWAKHFCVSAAITLLSDEVLSDAAGLLKEELDADIGGSGFSFADLLADKAGTIFAIRAIHDEASARALQDRIAEGFRVDDFFPLAADLPDGIPDAELQAYYGGVGGEIYCQVIEKIERRIAACDAYR